MSFSTKDRRRKFENLILSSIIILALIIFFGTLIFAEYNSISNDYFCEGVFPSPVPDINLVFDNDWGESSMLEPGYVRCCRYILIDHEKVKQCEIFNKGEQ